MRYFFLFMFISLLSCGDSSKMDFQEEEVLKVYDADLIAAPSDGLVYLKKDMTPVTGIVIARNYNNQIISKSTYKLGRCHGLIQSWFDSGQLKHRSNFKEGKINGLYEEWYENGQLKVKEKYKNGQKNGTAKSWYSSGQIMYEKQYNQDLLIGQKCWNEKGNEMDCH